MAGDDCVHRDRTQRAGLPPQIDVEALVPRMALVHGDDLASFFLLNQLS
jgi:hypothetical protein